MNKFSNNFIVIILSIKYRYKKVKIECIIDFFFNTNNIKNNKSTTAS